METPQSPAMSIVGASRAAGEVASTDRIGTADKAATMAAVLVR